MKLKTRYLAIAALLILVAFVPGLSSGLVAQNGLMQVTGVSWYGVNSSELAAPGDTYAPLYVSFVNSFGTVSDLSVNVNLNNSAVFHYSHINGSSSVVTENITYSQGGTSYAIVQPLNISSTAKTGIYTLELHYSFVSNSTVFEGNTSFSVPLLGTVHLVSTQSYFGSQSSPLIGTPGMKNVPLTVVLENTGNSFVQNISLSYTPSMPLSGVTQTTYISAMQAFGYATATFMVSIPASVTDGIYSQSITASYSGIQKNVTFSVPVTGYSNVSLVTYYTNPPVIYQNMKFIRLTAVLANSGNSFATDLGISAQSSSFKVLTGNYSIPYLQSGGVINATFLINAPASAGTGSLTLNAGQNAYTLNFNVRSSGSISISSSVPPMKPGQSQALETFTVKNTGNVAVYGLSMYLITPSVISVHVSSSNPLSGLTANNFTIGQLNPGQSFKVTFLVDVSSSATSGNYQAQLFMSYRLNESAMKFTQTYSFENTVQPTTVQSFENFLNVPIEEFIVFIVIVVIIIGVVGYAARSRRRKRKK